MALDTYTGLQEAIATFAMRSDDTEFEAMCPTFIQLCEQVLNYGSADAPPLRVADMETYATAPITDGEVGLPGDFLAPRTITAGIYGALTFITPEEALTRFAQGGDGAFFTMFGTFSIAAGSFDRPMPSGK